MCIRDRFGRGEYVVNASAAERNLPLLNTINRGGNPNSGPPTFVMNFGEITVNVEGGTENGNLTEEQSENIGRQMQQQIGDTVRSIILSEQRPGGTLFPAGP